MRAPRAHSGTHPGHLARKAAAKRASRLALAAARAAAEARAEQLPPLDPNAPLWALAPPRAPADGDRASRDAHEAALATVADDAVIAPPMFADGALRGPHAMPPWSVIKLGSTSIRLMALRRRTKWFP